MAKPPFTDILKFGFLCAAFCRPIKANIITSGEEILENTVKIRLRLFFGSVITIFLVAGFLIVLNVNEPYEYTRVPFQVLLILTLIACIAMAFFYVKGPVFDISGRLESTNINAMLLTVLIIIQISFLFEIISVRNQIMNHKIYNDIQHDIAVLEKSEPKDLNDAMRQLCADSIKKIYISTEYGTVLYSSDKTDIGRNLENTEYVYSFHMPNRICFYVDKGFIYDQLKSITLNLLTVLVTSIFLSVEIILFMLRLISKGIDRKAAENEGKSKGKKSASLYVDDEDKSSLTAFENSDVPTSLYYIRQIAFMFYFTSRLSSAFIPIMAKSLPNPFKFVSSEAAAGIPQSAEILFTCAAIFITTVILEKKGWKLPFLAGLGMVAAGTFLSGLAFNLPLFILSRAIVGLGYGVCWMTLRNLSLFGKNDTEQLLGFALLNAGIYAGMNCGASFGAILADVFGYKIVFIISACFTILISFFVIRLENAYLPKQNVKIEVSEDSRKAKPKGVISAILFVVLMIAPASIAASFVTYYLPMFFEHIGKNVTDVGRVQMVYGLFVVFAGPSLSLLISKSEGKTLKRANYFYNLLIALSIVMPAFGAGILFPFIGSSLLGTADSFGFGVQNNYFLGLPAVKKLGPAKSLSILSFLKKMLEMTGPFVFAYAISLGYRKGLIILSAIFASMTIIYAIYVFIDDWHGKNLFNDMQPEES